MVNKYLQFSSSLPVPGAERCPGGTAAAAGVEVAVGEPDQAAGGTEDGTEGTRACRTLGAKG